MMRDRVKGEETGTLLNRDSHEDLVSGAGQMIVINAEAACFYVNVLTVTFAVQYSLSSFSICAVLSALHPYRFVLGSALGNTLGWGGGGGGGERERERERDFELENFIL